MPVQLDVSSPLFSLLSFQLLKDQKDKLKHKGTKTLVRNKEKNLHKHPPFFHLRILTNSYYNFFFTDNRPSLLKLDLFCKQTSLALVIFGKKRMILKIKFMLQKYSFVDDRF